MKRVTIVPVFGRKKLEVVIDDNHRVISRDWLLDNKNLNIDYETSEGHIKDLEYTMEILDTELEDLVVTNATLKEAMLYVCS